jgi:hypothetical protein
LLFCIIFILSKLRWHLFRQPYVYYLQDFVFAPERTKRSPGGVNVEI